MATGTANCFYRTIAGHILAAGTPGIPAVAQHTVCGIVGKTQFGKMKTVNFRGFVTGKTV
jgi:hypothetical protein